MDTRAHGVSVRGQTGRERLLAGKDTWWFLGPGGTARLGSRHVTAAGELLPETRRRLRELGLYTPAEPHSYGLTVLTSTDCNLGCGYCFQNTGQDPAGGSRPPRIAHARLTPQTITAIMEFARRQMAASGLEKLHLMLFGGEPLLNPRGCLDLLAAAAGYGMTSAGMVSNLTLLTPELACELSARGLRSVQVTFDGDREDHDRIRVRRAGGGSFEAIVRNVERASQVTPLTWLFRVNVSHHNHAGIDSLLERLAAKLDPARCSIYFARVGDARVGYVNDLGYDGQVSQDFIRWHRRALALGFATKRPAAHEPCFTCGYGDGRYGATVSADGTLASCWDNAGKPEWEVGNVRDGYLPARATRERWTTCADLYESADAAEALASFEDRVDAALLDDLRALGLL